jgi:hypothetical protein
MGVACQASATATGRLVCEPKVQGQDAGEHAFDKRLAVAKQLRVCRFVVKIDGDSLVFAGLTGLVLPGMPSGHWVFAVYDTLGGNS